MTKGGLCNFFKKNPGATLHLDILNLKIVSEGRVFLKEGLPGADTKKSNLEIRSRYRIASIEC